MGQVGGEAVAALESVAERTKHIQIEFSFAAAAAADQVLVLALGRQVVASHARVEVGVAQQAELLQHLQRAIHGRDVHVGEPRSDLLVQALGRHVALGGGNGLENQLALGRHAQAALLQHAAQLGRVQHAGTVPQPAAIATTCKSSGTLVG
jgi:hypothetical protein